MDTGCAVWENQNDIMKSNTSKTYSEQFRADALDLLQTSGKGITQVSRDLGISANTLRNWRNSARRSGAMSSKNEDDSSSLSPEALYAQNEQLRRENEYLRRQRDILKKAASILAEDPQPGLR